MKAFGCTSPARWSSVVTITLLLASASPSQAFWNIGARRSIRKADERMEQGRKAEDDQRILEACDAYSQAYELYQAVQRESPGTQDEHVLRQIAECRARIRTLFARANNGQSTTPSPDEILPILGAPRATTEPPRDAPPPVADFAGPSAESPEEPPEETSEALFTTRRRSWFKRILPGRDRTPQPDPERADSADAESERLPAAVAMAPEPDASRPPSDRELTRQVQAMLERGEGAEAVLLLERIVETAGARATPTQRILFAQALMDRRNYPRAEALLDALREEHPENLSVRTLAAGVHLAKGHPIAALRLMDELVREYPRYADAYINLAYVRFAMDPAGNRDEAIVYYRHALTLGARRDPRLETELRIDVDP